MIDLKYLSLVLVMAHETQTVTSVIEKEILMNIFIVLTIS